MKRVKKFECKFDNGKYIYCDFCKDDRDRDEVYQIEASYIRNNHVLSLCFECLMEVKRAQV